jgi:hypothetical protein
MTLCMVQQYPFRNFSPREAKPEGFANQGIQQDGPGRSIAQNCPVE